MMFSCTNKLVLTLVSALFASTLWGQETASVAIDSKTILGPVNPMVFGNNVSCFKGNGSWTQSSETGAGRWDPATHSVQQDYLAGCKDIGIKLERYPSGSDAEAYVWTDFVGPKETRPKCLFGLDEWITWCKALGAEPLFTVNSHSTPQQAADLIDFLNGPADDAHPWAQKRAAWGHVEPYHVKYFELGNETYFEKKRFPTGAAYADWAEPVDHVMRSRSPGIQIGLVGKFNWGRDSTEWNESVFSRKTIGDFAVQHSYPNGCEPENYANEDVGMGALMIASEQYAAMYRRIHNRIHELSGRDIPLAVTEYNGYFLAGEEKFKKYEYYLRSWGNAFFCGDLVREMLLPSNHVLMANYFITDLQVGRRFQRLPAYFVYRLWSQHTGSTLVSSKVEASPRVKFDRQIDIIGPTETSAISTLASRRENGTICLMLLNREMRSEISATIRVEGRAVVGAKYWQVTSPTLANNNRDNANMETVSGDAVVPTSGSITVNLPKFSMTAVELDVR